MGDISGDKLLEKFKVKKPSFAGPSVPRKSWNLFWHCIGALLGGAVIVVVALYFLASWSIGDWNPFARGQDIRWEVLARVALPAAALFAGIIGAVIAGHGQATRLEELQNDRDANVTDRYTNGVEQLSNVHASVRIGGIYALERIAQDSDRDRKTIVRVLQSNLVSQLGAGLVAEQEAALVLALLRLRRVGERNELESLLLDIKEIISADLRGAYLHDVNLSKFLLFGADLRGADLSESSLYNTVLFRANLDGANLQGADLTGAELFEASIQGRILRKRPFRVQISKERFLLGQSSRIQWLTPISWRIRI
ncbi:pentapeptide repeat-containing protein [Arthrobacter alpinus]|nr:pentapeptide repeat-containing protein [Arthrobacter alpinus]